MNLLHQVLVDRHISARCISRSHYGLFSRGFDRLYRDRLLHILQLGMGGE